MLSESVLRTITIFLYRKRRSCKPPRTKCLLDSANVTNVLLLHRKVIDYPSFRDFATLRTFARCPFPSCRICSTRQANFPLFFPLSASTIYSIFGLCTSQCRPSVKAKITNCVCISLLLVVASFTFFVGGGGARGRGGCPCLVSCWCCSLPPPFGWFCCSASLVWWLLPFFKKSDQVI